MMLILAHSGRGFQPAHKLEGVPDLVGLDNVFFDTSANCEPIAHQAIIRILGHERLMYGTDLPISHMRGRSLSAADTFIWLYEQTPVWKENHSLIEPVLIGLEHLRSLKWACWSENLTDSQVEDIFYNNAAKLLGLYPRKGAIAVGSDADFAIIDPSAKKSLSMNDLHVRDYSPWEGWEVDGWPTTVILRGKVMVDKGQLLGTGNDGQLIPRKINPAVLQRPAF